MSRFNTRDNRKIQGKSVVETERTATGRTAMGGPGFAREAKGELFLLAAVNTYNAAFHEKEGARNARFEKLIAEVGMEDPLWVGGMLDWLRHEGNLRTASMVGAIEFIRARRAADAEAVMTKHGRGVERWTMDRVLNRADEPGEALMYYASQYGWNFPKPVKRGVGDAAFRLYSERSLLKYDTPAHPMRFGRVLDLTHPEIPVLDYDPEGHASLARKRSLLEFAVARWHGSEKEWLEAHPESLSMIRLNRSLIKEAETRPEVLLDTFHLRASGLTWQNVLSMAGSRLSKKAVWEALAPTMGYFALLRNLRNFDEADLSDEAAYKIAGKLTDVEEIRSARLFPMHMLAAYRAAPSLRWAYPLERALNMTLENVPALDGETLILIDSSQSMDNPFSKDGTLMRWDAAVLFGLALAARAESAKVVSFSNAYGGRTPNMVFPLRKRESLLASIARWKANGFFIAGGTDTAAAVNMHYTKQFKRVIVLTDEQAQEDRSRGVDVFAGVPDTVPTYTWNLAGYQYGHAAGGRNRHTFGGLTDKGLEMIQLIEAGKNQSWPWAPLG